MMTRERWLEREQDDLHTIISALRDITHEVSSRDYREWFADLLADYRGREQAVEEELGEYHRKELEDEQREFYREAI